MTTGNILNEVEAALANMTQGDFVDSGRRLLGTLGYHSDRTLDLSGSVDDFIAEFAAPNPNTQTETRFRERAASARILFQYTDSEISAAQPSLLETGGFDKGDARSFMFIAVELRDESYPRGAYVELTREINKRLVVPVAVLFRTAAGRLSLAFVHRRPHKRDRRRSVLGSVSLIREIEPAKPHRAHLDILEKLALPERLAWMDIHRRKHNFDGLLDAWLDALDTEELNRNFYKQLFTWFERAVNEAKFPTKQARTLRAEEHVIRLITRLLFVWFIKEKGLIAPELFIEEQIGPLLRDYDNENGDSYYRAVLQNLFFATLNSEIGDRGFSKESNVTHRDFSRYRYKAEIVDLDRLLELFAQTPFINGGLFDCLDSFESTSEGGYRIDCFTDNLIEPRRKEFGILSIPNRLFFDDKGLISLFDRFQFTVEENTPAEQEVALDPELLGKVFENLLAAYNPETRDTARRQTGSYYTPRAVVDYMVDEALIASLAHNCPPANGDTKFWKERLSYLLDYEDAFDDAHELFEDHEKEGLVRAIAGIKLIDPAVGSGAFPMGALHKLTLALRRLDPDNQRWESLQKELAGKRATAAFDTRDQAERDAELEEISATFEKYRGSDFGRKLYLIQNSIYGVDIQPIACQIARLRFFISLAIEQEPGGEIEDNYGIKPLPNLETRFVAANTLLKLDTSGMQMSLTTPEVTQLQEELNANRERHFHATTRQKKKECRDHDRELRDKLATALQQVVGLPAADAANISGWDPYDQNTQSNWFDAGYMFGVAEGFDLVIGNPPYIQLQKDGCKLGKLYKDAGYTTFARTGDIYLLFFEKGCQLLRPGQGFLSYITSNSWLKAEYGKRLRRYFSEHHTPLRLLELGKDIFENAIVDTSILIVRSGMSGEVGFAVDVDRLTDKKFPPEQNVWGPLRYEGERPWCALSAIEQGIMDKMEAIGTPLKEWDIDIYRGVLTGYNKAFIVNDRVRATLVAEDPKSAEIIKPVLRGRDIQRYQAQWAGLWMIATFPSLHLDINDYPAVKRHLLSHNKERLEQAGKNLADGSKSRKKTPHHWYELQDTCAYHAQFKKEKLFWMHMSSRGRFAYSNSEIYCNQKAFFVTGHSLLYLCAILNSTLVTWLMRNTAVTTGMGLTQWDKFVVERIPIPTITVSEQRSFVHLVESILSVKADNPLAETTCLENEIDELVYSLYGLSADETVLLDSIEKRHRQAS
ncbi:MAG: Eco57I restriction-modification methylase domain-containing protein [Caldilineaceae bacterium]|nr:Eco57I restriction-modification methylase domain-containing protein [Caldilineaceae bacterium]